MADTNNNFRLKRAQVGVWGAIAEEISAMAPACDTVAFMTSAAAFAFFLTPLESDGKLSKIQEAFREKHGLQCGFCTPGMIMSAAFLLAENPHPTEEEIRWGIAGNLCRCTGYSNIVSAVKYAADNTGGDSE